MSTATTADVVGTARDRVDGRLKVMGAATYPIDVTLFGMAQAALFLAFSMEVTNANYTETRERHKSRSDRSCDRAPRTRCFGTDCEGR
jgi:hypothetical protein